VPIPCIPIPGVLAVGCLGDVAHAASNAVASQWAETLRQAALQMMQAAIAPWSRVHSTDIASGALWVQSRLWWLTAAVAVVSLIWQGARLAIQRQADPLVSIGRGLATLAVAQGLGLAIFGMALQVGDVFSAWVFTTVDGGHLGESLVRLLAMQRLAPGLVLVFGVAAIVSGACQAILMVLRQGGLILLAGCLPAAAAGAGTVGMRPILSKLIRASIALILYKPAAALIYALGISLAGTGDSVAEVITGLAVIIAAIFAFPILMKTFSFVDHMGGGAAGSGALVGAAGAATGAAQAAGAWKRSGGQAAETAARGEQAYGPAGGAPTAAEVPAQGGAAAGASAGSGAAAGGAAAAGPAGVVAAGAQTVVAAAQGAAHRSAAALSGADTTGA